jgi:hypothetical protein
MMLLGQREVASPAAEVHLEVRRRVLVVDIAQDDDGAASSGGLGQLVLIFELRREGDEDVTLNGSGQNRAAKGRRATSGHCKDVCLWEATWRAVRATYNPQ